MILETKNRLILLEGLLGTGKSADSFRLYEQPATKAPDGTYVNAYHGFSFTIRENVMTDPEGVRSSLSPRSQEEFFVEGIPTILHFYGGHSVSFLGQQIIPQWTETGLVYPLEN